MSDYCSGCGRTDMAGITHVCPPLSSPHTCSPPAVVGLAVPQQPDWMCGTCGRIFRDMRTMSGIQWWAEIQSPAPIPRRMK